MVSEKKMVFCLRSYHTSCLYYRTHPRSTPFYQPLFPLSFFILYNILVFYPLLVSHLPQPSPIFLRSLILLSYFVIFLSSPILAFFLSATSIYCPPSLLFHLIYLLSHILVFFLPPIFVFVLFLVLLSSPVFVSLPSPSPTLSVFFLLFIPLILESYVCSYLSLFHLLISHYFFFLFFCSLFFSSSLSSYASFAPTPLFIYFFSLSRRSSFFSLPYFLWSVSYLTLRLSCLLYFPFILLFSIFLFHLLFLSFVFLSLWIVRLCISHQFLFFLQFLS